MDDLNTRLDTVVLAKNRIEELERELEETQDRANAFATKEYYTEIRAERAEAKLAMAMKALDYFFMRDPDKSNSWEYGRNKAEALALATLRGEGEI